MWIMFFFPTCIYFLTVFFFRRMVQSFVSAQEEKSYTVLYYKLSIPQKCHQTVIENISWAQTCPLPSIIFAGNCVSSRLLPFELCFQ